MIESANRYSSRVTIMLAVAGLHLDVAQVVDGTLHLRETAGVAPCDAELIITIDGKLVRQPVILHDGIQKGEKTVRYF